MKGISVNDPRIATIHTLQKCACDLEMLALPSFQFNDIFYTYKSIDSQENSVKKNNDNLNDCKLTKEKKHNQKIVNIKNKTEYNDDIKRVLIAEQHILYLGLDIGCNLSEHGFINNKVWYQELKKIYGSIFDVGIDNYKKYASLTKTSPHIKREVKLHKFNKGTPKRASNKD